MSEPIWKPMDIEKESFRIITREIQEMGRELPGDKAPVILRAIHTTADFSYLDTLYFSPGVMEQAAEALRSGCCVVTDTNMAKAGIHKASLERLGGEVQCFMADPDVAKAAKEEGVTRAAISMRKAAQIEKALVFCIGNAPTALFALADLIREGKLNPRVVIGAPVGFVNVIEAKELLMKCGVPCIVPRGRKGGSNVAAAILNALLYEVAGR